MVDAAVRKALAAVSAKDVTDLTCALIDIPSRTGEEERCARFLVEYMRDHGLEATYQEVDVQRGNAIGVLRGEGGGATLLFNGHLDTSFTGIEEEDYPVTGPLPRDLRPQSRVAGGLIYGLGAFNMKGGVASSVVAACALKRAGIRLRGDLMVTGVCGEIEKAPVDGAFRSYRGRLYSGCGFGTDWLVKHGGVADFVINEEPTGGHVSWENPGFCWFKVTVKGKLAYQSHKGAGVNAILKAARLAQAIEAWAPEYGERHRGELVYPNVVVSAIEAGYPYKPTFVPGICNLYVDVRLTPRITAMQARREFEALLAAQKARDPELDYDVELYMSYPASRSDPSAYVFDSLVRSVEAVTGRRPGPCPPELTSYLSDSSVFRRAGIPAATCGPGAAPRRRQAFGYGAMSMREGEYVAVDELVTAAKIYVVAAMDICRKDRRDLGLEAAGAR
jgi:acetylornithine deacetylase